MAPFYVFIRAAFNNVIPYWYFLRVTSLQSNHIYRRDCTIACPLERLLILKRPEFDTPKY